MLSIVATPIGNYDEITLKALKVLAEADIIICESTKETSKLFRHHGIHAKRFEVLNEHSTSTDLLDLLKLCQEYHCALVSDCGTPSFCDPGADLVGLCRQKNISIETLLGPSSLMGLLSLSSKKITQFVFIGFLPAENSSRELALKKIKGETRALVLMDTPYRLKKLLQEVEQTWPQRTCLLVRDLSLPQQQVWEGLPSDLRQKSGLDKAEFLLLVYPTA